MYTDASNVEDINISQIIERLSMSCIASCEEWSNIFRNHSPCSRMIVISEKGSILWRCQSPYHHRWQTCHLRVSPFLLPTCHQISTLEKTTCRQCSILSSLSAHHRSPCSWLLLIPRAQRYLTSRFGFPGAFRCSRGKHVRIPCAVSRDQIHHRLWLSCDNTYNKAYWWEDKDVWGNKNNLIQITDHSLRLLAFVNPNRWRTRVTFVL